MENYAPAAPPAYPASYPDSGESSPRSREIEFENPPPWDDHNYKVKFMCSYGGKIQPRTHDNQLSYVGGDTKILAVDRNIKFPSILSKLSAICNCDNPADLSFKYQLPGEDLDALISVTNDDDLDHMMHEYDRLYRASARPSRMRLFLFLPENPLPSALAPAPVSALPDPVKPSNVDFLFGLDKPVAAPPLQPPLAAVNPVPAPVAPPPEYHQPRPNPSDRVVGSDPGVNHHIEIQRQLQRLQVADSEQGPYRRRSEDNAAGNYPAGDYYAHAQKAPEKLPASNFPVSAPPPPQNQAGYWQQQEKAVSGEVYHSAAPGGGDQPVYMIPGPGTFYHAPMVRPPATQGYYAMQRLPSDGYREQPPVYGGVPPTKPPYSSAVPVNYPPAQAVKAPAYTEGVSVVRQAGLPDNTAGAYAQVAYDSATGRHVYYTAPGGVVHAPPYQGVAPPGSTDLRPPGLSLGQDVKVINKVSQGSV